jgi:hypothetical protein
LNVSSVSATVRRWVLFIIPVCKHFDNPNFKSISNLGLTSAALPVYRPV